jgi:hypothetical protein
MKRFTFAKHHFVAKKATPEVLQAISTRDILWGQAVRTCIIKRQRPKQAALLLKHAVPRTSSALMGGFEAVGAAEVADDMTSDDDDNDGDVSSPGSYLKELPVRSCTYDPSSTTAAFYSRVKKSTDWVA